MRLHRAHLPPVPSFLCSEIASEGCTSGTYTFGGCVGAPSVMPVLLHGSGEQKLQEAEDERKRRGKWQKELQGCRAPKRKEVSLDEKKLKGNLVAKQGRT